jgi:hypothetical protein
MTDAEWTAVAAIASAAAAVGSLLSALFALQANRRAHKATDYQSCLSVMAEINAAERLVRHADGDERLFEFRALMNLIEVLASLVNHGDIPPTTRRNVEPYLEQTWAFLTGDPHMDQIRHEAITDDTTFGEIMKFAEARKMQIEYLRRRYHGLKARSKPA